MAKLGPGELQRRLERALKVGGNSMDASDIWTAVEEGRMQSWTKNDSLVVTEILTYPKGRALNVILAVGSLDDVMSLQPQIRDFGRDHGASVMRMQGREGWAAVLPAYGWKKVPQVIYEMEL
jgi:hypothetical protein